MYVPRWGLNLAGSIGVTGNQPGVPETRCMSPTHDVEGGVDVGRRSGDIKCCWKMWQL